MTKIKNVSVIGAGTMGNGIAHVMAQFGLKVNLIDLNKDALEAALASINKNLHRQVKKEIINEGEVKNILNRISISSSIENGVGEADLIIEAVSEDIKIKESVFRAINKNVNKDTIIASNTSSISITKLASFTDFPQQVIGMHFMNPVPVMKLVEIIVGHSTSNEVVKEINLLTTFINKIPVEVNDYPGFVANRILMPMINEAIYCVFEGVGGAEQIDDVMQLGMAHPMGPLKLADYIGLDVCLAILKVLHEGFGNPKYAPCPLLVKMVDSGQLGMKSKKGFYSY